MQFVYCEYMRSYSPQLCNTKHSTNRTKPVLLFMYQFPKQSCPNAERYSNFGSLSISSHHLFHSVFLIQFFSEKTPTILCSVNLFLLASWQAAHCLKSPVCPSPPPTTRVLDGGLKRLQICMFESDF